MRTKLESRKKEAGILMPVFALPSRCGMGDLGEGTSQWIQMMKNSGIKIWQILPLNPVGYGNSPYQPYSSYAGDELYISLERLWEEGLLKEKPDTCDANAKHIDYERVRAYKTPFLREAYAAFCECKKQDTTEYQQFIAQKWVEIYGVFRALKKKNRDVCWNQWEEEDRDWPELCRELTEEERKEADYQMFLQYTFFCQWMRIKREANEAGIRIMGDVPFYVGLDSADVWGGKNRFLLDKDGRPIFIAGVPPDYFSATGQRWGNPIYDWKQLKKEEYRFWTDRIGYSGMLFDIVRIDHFRAFDTYWKIPSSCPTAVEGEWIEAPGYEVLDILTETLKNVELVAEDLGDLRSEVLQLKEHYGWKGMKILMFSIRTDGKWAYDEFQDTENMIIYTGTHDNDTLMEWYQKLSIPARRKVRRFLARKGYRQGSVKERLLDYTFDSRAQYAIVPMQDILGLGVEGHMNTPGTVGSPNWEWRMPAFEEAEKVLEHLRYHGILEREKWMK